MMKPKRDKREFIYRYRHEFKKLSAVKVSVWYPKMNYSPLKTLVKYIANRARIELDYSYKTTDTDIVWLLFHQRLF